MNSAVSDGRCMPGSKPVHCCYLMRNKFIFADLQIQIQQNEERKCFSLDPSSDTGDYRFIVDLDASCLNLDTAHRYTNNIINNKTIFIQVNMFSEMNLLLSSKDLST